MNEAFLKELKNSGYIHIPLALHPERSLEAGLDKKQVLARKSLWYDGADTDFALGDTGRRYLAKGMGHDGKNAVAISAPLRSEHPEWLESGGQYTNFGTLKITLPIGGESWESFNRLSFYVKPDYRGGENVHLIVGVSNDGKEKLPDVYYREGFHVVNLKNHEYNHIIWEVQDMPRDKVTELVFYMFLSGNNGLTGKEVLYYIDDVSLETVEHPDHAKGWKAPYDLVSYPTSGYLPKSEKTAVSTVCADSFSLMDAKTGKTVFTGTPKTVSNPHGTFALLDFSAFTTEGEYRLRVGSYETAVFPISASVVEEAVWKIINFLFCQRCGYPVPGIHESCHRDMIAEHNGKKIAFTGGWHDAGDLTQSVLQTAEISAALLEAADHAEENSMLQLRLLEEGEWGIDCVTHCRFGDGWRIEGQGNIRYTDGVIGTFDDIRVNVGCNMLNNFIYSAAEAYAGIVLGKRYPGRGQTLTDIAAEDFDFALAAYEKDGYIPTKGGHERTTGEGLFFAYASIAASRLYQATGEEKYAGKAVYFGEKMLQYQETGGAGIPITGFFYRDKTHLYPQHFNHMSREQGFMKALVLLCETQSAHEHKPVWEHSMRLYGEYLKALMAYAAPYGIVPSGVYSTDEINSEEAFSYMHPGSKYEDERENVAAQIYNGVRLNDKFYVRVFPVWCSFRGNAAVQCASGKAASMLGAYFGDDTLTQIGLEQLYWIAGKNPFLQSMIYGEGHRYCQQYAISTGEVTGEIPVGMESYQNEDIPYWPQGNNCTYKEVWVVPAGRYLSLAADLL